MSEPRQSLASDQSPEGQGAERVPTSRVRFLRKTYQQTRQFIGDFENEESEGSDFEDVVTSTCDDQKKDQQNPPEMQRRMSSKVMPQDLPRKDFLWKKVQAVVTGTKRVIQQRNSLLARVRMSIQECVERQRVAKQIQESMMQGSGTDWFAGLKESLDADFMDMLQQIVAEATKFQVLNIPEFVHKVLDFVMSDALSAETLLNDSLLDAMQDAMEREVGDIFEMDELRTNIMEKVYAFKQAFSKVSGVHAQEKMQILDCLAESPIDAVRVNSKETPDVVFEDVNVDMSSDLAKKGNELMKQITSAPHPEEPDFELEIAGVSDEAAGKLAFSGSCTLEPATPSEPSPCEDGRGKVLSTEAQDLPANSVAEDDVSDPWPYIQPAISGSTSSVSSPRSPTQVPSVSSRAGPFRSFSHQPQRPALAQVKNDTEMDDMIAGTSDPTSTMSTMSKTWNGVPLMILGKATSERLVSKAPPVNQPVQRAAVTSGMDAFDRLPVLPMYRNASKEASKRHEFRAKKKAFSLDNDLPKLGHLQPISSFSMSNGSGRFGYSLPNDTLRQPSKQRHLVSPRRNPPSHPAPRQMAWMLLPGVSD